MNVLFLLRDDSSSSSLRDLATYARHLQRLGHACAVAFAGDAAAPANLPEALPTARMEGVLADPHGLFHDGRAADILHAWSADDIFRSFIAPYLARRPTPWLVQLGPSGLISARTASADPTTGCEGSIRLADAAVVPGKVSEFDVPPWVPCTEVRPAVDLEFFAPHAPHPGLRAQWGFAEGEKVIVHAGNADEATRPGLDALCMAIGLLNQAGTKCRLLRCGTGLLESPAELPAELAGCLVDLGIVPRDELPALYSMADVLVHPGRPGEPSLPAAVPEWLASGRPVVLPAHAAGPLEDGVEACLHRNGGAEELAHQCLMLLRDPERARRMGQAARRFAERHLNAAVQVARLEHAYRAAIDAFDPEGAAGVWREAGTTSVAQLLARRLRLLASARLLPSAGELAAALARQIEAAQGLAAEFESRVKAQAERATELSAAAQATEAELSTLGRAVVTLEERLAESRHDAFRLREEIAAARRIVAEREQRAAALETSLSWRLTRPLRAAGSLAGRLGRRARDSHRR